MSIFITDRLPTADDGDNDGDVCIERRPGQGNTDPAMIHWSYVKEGTPWRHTACWRPRRELPGVNGQWIRANAVKPTATDADKDGHVQVYRESSDSCVHWYNWHSWDNLDNSVLWRPYTHCDKRPLEPAGHRLPGYLGEYISGHDALPVREDGDKDGDVLMEIGLHKQWNKVLRSERWRPTFGKDTRPRRSN